MHGSPRDNQLEGLIIHNKQIIITKYIHFKYVHSIGLLIYSSLESNFGLFPTCSSSSCNFGSLNDTQYMSLLGETFLT